MESKDLWQKYEKGVSYNSQFKPNKDYYEAVKVWNSFYNGDQWLGLEGDQKLPHPTFNIIKRVTEFLVASLTSSNVAVNIEPLENIATEEAAEFKISDFLNAEVKNIFEKTNFEYKIKEALTDGAITGDMCYHVVFNPNKRAYRGQDILGEIEIELIEATNVLFGNPNIKDVEKQPYIIIVGRDLVKNLQEEAKNKSIRQDSETMYQTSEYADTEIEGDDEGKALYIYYYYKKNDKVYCTKTTKDVIIYENVDMQLTRYPIAHGNFYKQKGTYHGRGVVESVCPNQISINKLFAMAIYHQMMTAFPPLMIDKDMVDTINNEVGSVIELHGLKNSDRRFNDVAGYLNPANMSEWIIKIIDLCFQYTKECLGVSDASLGQINPTNTSAIIAVQKSTAVPLANIKDNLYHLVEQVVLILIDMMSSKYGVRPVVMETDGLRQLVSFDFSALKNMDLKTSIDVGETSYWSEISTLQTLDSLLQAERIDFLQYLERVPNEFIPKKAELISDLKQQVEMQQPGQPVNNNAMYEQMAQYMDTLPLEEQQQIMNMNPAQQENYLVNLMNQQ
jgi:hypothetical protein